MTFSMALVMSGMMGFINGGAAFLPRWPLAFAIAWPLAFLVASFVNPLAFRLAHRIAPPAKG
jgi:hypothetical protein